MSVTVRWNGGPLRRQVRKLLADGLEDCGRITKFHLKKVLNVPYPPASSPGEPPHRRTGTLRDAQDFKVNRTTLKLEIFTGETAPYWVFLEKGTAIMDPRPFLRVTVKMLFKRYPKIIKNRFRKGA